MILQLKNIITIAFTSAIILMSLAGCSPYKELVDDKNITIKRINSDTAMITRARLSLTEENKLILRGELKRKTHLKGKVPGHLHVELINASGTVFKEGKFNYRRKVGNSRSAKFSIPILVEAELIKSVRIMHHGLRSHFTNSEKSPWVDVKAGK